MSTIEDIQTNLKDQKGLSQYNVEELKYVQKPLGKALYKHVGRPKSENKAHWNDKIICKICGGKFTRSARTGHDKTKVHQIYAKMNDKMRKLLI